MNAHQRFFGGGPIGSVLEIALLLAAFRLQNWIGLPPVHNNPQLGSLLLAAFGAVSAALFVWSLVSLPPLSRGTRVVREGVFRYLRHPLYASFMALSFGLAFWLDNWIYVVWAALQLPVWRVSVAVEERLMRRDFPGEYDEYCRHTRRFIPGVW